MQSLTQHLYKSCAIFHRFRIKFGMTGFIRNDRLLFIPSRCHTELVSASVHPTTAIHTAKSFHSGFIFSTKEFFHFLCQFFSCFSRAIADSISLHSSKYTSFSQLYLSENPSYSWFLCCKTRFCKSLVTPMYKTELVEFVIK